MQAKADFKTTDGREFQVIEYRTREEWEWDHQYIVDYDLVELRQQFVNDQLEKLSASPYSFQVVLGADDIERADEKKIVSVARYSIQVWLEHNRLTNRYCDHMRAIILRPFS